MKKLIVFSLIFLSSLAVSANDARDKTVVYELFEVMEMPTMYQQTIEQMLDMQIQQNPSIEPFHKMMSLFFEKYIGWDSMRDEMAELYMQSFTDEELKELVAFYKTPIGQKTILLTPALTAEGAAIGQRRVQENMPELQLMIAEEGMRIAEKERASKTTKSDSDE